MRILLASRLFSGIEQSIIDQKWSPTGAPAIYKLIEALDTINAEVRIILASKDSDRDNLSQWVEKKDLNVPIEGLRLVPTVLAGESALPTWMGKSRRVFREFRHAWRIWREIKRFNPEVVYLDNANLLAAALISRLTPTRVVFRLMGVYPSMRNCIQGKGLRNSYLRFCYRSPFYFSLCVIDGSGGGEFMRRTFAKSVPKLTVLNGVEPTLPPEHVDPKLSNLPKDRTVVLFVGKIESFKGVKTFIDSLIILEKDSPGAFHGLLIGKGTELEKIKTRISDAAAEGLFTMIEHLPHEQIFAAHKCSDIYVSLNLYGNMSNANLEAISIGQCIIIPHSQIDTGVDMDTDAVIPLNSVRRLSNINDAGELANILLGLHHHPERQEHMRAETSKLAKSLLWSWHDRIDWEVNILQTLANGNMVTPSTVTNKQAVWVGETER